MKVSLDTIVNLAKRRGFVFPGSEIYGGLANSWDYGPLGVQLKKNILDAWWKRFVEQRGDMVGIDSAILMNPKVWEVSGHVGSFSDPLVEDTKTHKRYRADHFLEEALGKPVVGLSMEEMAALITEHDVKSPEGNPLSSPKQFNLLFETGLGKVEGDKQKIYLRGELAQGMFVNFKNVADTMRKQLPFGIAQTGRVFRNEITPGQFTYRTLEFDLMEFEYFIRAEQWEEKWDYWLEEMHVWLESIGISRSSLRVREHTKEELSHYSTRTADIEYNSPFGWKEICGFAYRTDFDLKNHAQASGVDLRITDNKTGEKFFPHVLEPAFGHTRHVLFLLMEAYDEEEVKGEKRVVLRFKPHMAPYQVAVLPLMKKPELTAVAEKVAQDLRKDLRVEYDVTGSIGKRYRRQDEIGTPWAITIDYDTLEDTAVTIRDRDTMKQERVKIEKVAEWLNSEMINSQ